MAVCPDCGLELPEGCLCGWLETDDFIPTTGSDSDATVVTPRIDPVEGNLVVDGASGLEAITADRYLNPPRFRIYRNAAQTIADGTQATEPILWNAERYDAFAMHSNTVDPDLVVIPTAGLWKMGVSVRFTSGNGAQELRVTIFTNRRSSVLNRFGWERDNGRASVQYIAFEAEGHLRQGDIMEVHAEVTGGGQRDIGTSGGNDSTCEWWGSFRGDLTQ